jgi:hypothetical protein
MFSTIAGCYQTAKDGTISTHEIVPGCDCSRAKRRGGRRPTREVEAKASERSERPPSEGNINIDSRLFDVIFPASRGEPVFDRARRAQFRLYEW